MKFHLIAVLFFATIATSVINGQPTQNEFSFHLEATRIEGLGGIQSYAYGIYQGKWIIIGGRLDGLHRRQPFASFDKAGHNTKIWVVSPEENKVWTRSLEGLDTSIAEQCRSTNMQFAQRDSFLFLTGGYGYSDIEQNHTTFPFLTSINLPQLIAAILNEKIIAPAFHQVRDPKLQVTGGRLIRLNDTFYLAGGHTFIGRYNPMGPDRGPGFIQNYSNSILSFTIHSDDTSLRIEHHRQWKDSLILHRRDLNVLPQRNAGGINEAIMFSGVFQHEEDLPYQNAIRFSEKGFEEMKGFRQFFNHYHCATLGLYSARNDAMHNVFFGGIAQFTKENRKLIQDNDVPFTTSISSVSRFGHLPLQEYLFNTTMPGYLGSGSELLLKENIPVFPEGIIDLDKLISDSIHIGYIFGGIRSTAPSIFWTNEGHQSEASFVVYKIYLIKQSHNSAILNPQSQSSILFNINYNPETRYCWIDLELEKDQQLSISISDEKGKKLIRKTKTFKAGKQEFAVTLKSMEIGQKLHFDLSNGKDTFSRSVIIRE